MISLLKFDKLTSGELNQFNLSIYMSLKYRRILYISFFIIFFIAAPLVILWAGGYHYDFTRHKIQKTGGIFIESKPSKAEVYLNNKKQDKKTTARLKNLLPNQYEVRIEKNGYQTWQKKLPVYPGQTTFIQYIRLFKKNPKIKNILNKKIILSSQKNGNELAIIYPQNKKFGLALFNLASQNLKELATLNYQPNEIILSPHKSFIFLKYNPKYSKDKWLLDTNGKKLIDLAKIIPKGTSKLKWLPNSKDEIIYGISKAGLEKIDFISKQTALVLKKAILDFYIINDQIFFLEKANGRILLKQTNFNKQDKFKTLTTLPISEDYKFFESRPNLLTLLDKKNEILYLIKTNGQNQNKKRRIKIFSETNYVKWLGNLLLFGNDFEISTYDIEKNELNLIVRLSSKIKKAIWYPTATHIVYLTAGGIKVIELANHQRNLHTLLKKLDVKNIFINQKGDKVYFIDENGINEAEIQ